MGDDGVQPVVYAKRPLRSEPVATYLSLDPFITLFQARTQCRRWLPTKLLADQSIVGISSTDS